MATPRRRLNIAEALDAAVGDSPAPADNATEKQVAPVQQEPPGAQDADAQPVAPGEQVAPVQHGIQMVQDTPVAVVAPGLPEQSVAPRDDVAQVQEGVEVQSVVRSEPMASYTAGPPNKESAGFYKTSRGYVRADGTEVRRKTLFFTEEQWRALQMKTLEAGYGTNTSLYVIECLNLNEG